MTTTTPGPLDRCTYRGAQMDEKTKAAIQRLEAALGYPLTITQGCYSTAVGASAGTHAGGGVVDLAPWDHARKVKIGRDQAWAIWYRPELWRDGRRIWPAHCHAVLIGHEALSDEAADQVEEYLAGGDGLAGVAGDPNPYRPAQLEPFRFGAWRRDLRIRARMLTLRAQIGRIRDRISANRNRITY